MLRLQACSRRPHFDVLMPLLRPPWNDLLLNAKPVAYDIILRAIAARREFEADFGSVFVAGFPIGPMGLDSAAPGRLTPMVGVPSKITDLQVEELGRRLVKPRPRPETAEEAEALSDDPGGKHVDPQTGYKIDARFKRDRSILAPTGNGVWLARKPRCSGSGDGPQVMIVRLGPSLKKTQAGVQLYEGRAVACHTVPDLPLINDDVQRTASGELPGTPWVSSPSSKKKSAASPRSPRRGPPASKTVTYCAYLTGAATLHVSYCINATVSDAKQHCAERVKRQGLDSICECTDDKEFIGSRCG